MTIGREEFQLSPIFDINDLGADCANTLKRFQATCRFDKVEIATCGGTNKKDAKALSAKLALYRCAPLVYRGIFQDEQPPEPQEAAETLPEIPNEAVTLADRKNLLNSGGQHLLFKNYTLFQCFKSLLRVNKWTLDENERDNPHSKNRDQNTIYLFEVYDSNKKLIYTTKHPVSTKTMGRNTCALDILTQIYGSKKKWLELVDEVKKLIEKERDLRGAPEKPVWKSQNEYLAEQRRQ
jgi:hypothetical protein